MHRPLREKFVAEARRALKIPWKRRWIILLVLIAAGLLAAVRLGRNDGPAYYTSRVETGDIKQVVEATGTINAVIRVSEIVAAHNLIGTVNIGSRCLGGCVGIVDDGEHAADIQKTMIRKESTGLIISANDMAKIVNATGPSIRCSRDVNRSKREILWRPGVTIHALIPIRVPARSVKLEASKAVQTDVSATESAIGSAEARAELLCCFLIFFIALIFGVEPDSP